MRAMKYLALVAVFSGLTLVGCHGAGDPGPGVDGKTMVQQMNKEEYIDFIKRSPMPQSEKDKIIAKAEAGDYPGAKK
ncbi:MAG: hypothetical protein JST35_11675 [Armatimonadetes bacterium]|nr:hypothetical protein [Armatimonadota bacterium]